MLLKEDIERIVEGVLKELSIQIDRGDHTNPNSRCVLLKYKERELSRAFFSVEDAQSKKGIL